ncbi:hypothetical protein GQX74_006372 [Glossina fuscipes]|nr:hypothetical protein GQX74_006372 [Glossina fuscipes]
MLKLLPIVIFSSSSEAWQSLKTSIVVSESETAGSGNLNLYGYYWLSNCAGYYDYNHADNNIDHDDVVLTLAAPRSSETFSFTNESLKDFALCPNLFQSLINIPLSSSLAAAFIIFLADAIQLMLTYIPFMLEAECIIKNLSLCDEQLVIETSGCE